MASRLGNRLQTIFLCCMLAGLFGLVSVSYSQEVSSSEAGYFSEMMQEGRSSECIRYDALGVFDPLKRIVFHKDAKSVLADISSSGFWTSFAQKTDYSPKGVQIDLTTEIRQPETADVPPQAYKLEPIVVTAARREQPADNVPQNVTVLTKAEIESCPAHNLAEALNYVPGLAVQINGGPGNVAYPMIQGAEWRHTLVLIDGIPLNTQTEGMADMAQIPLGNVERIEIMKGPGSSVWGSSLGGVINVITSSAAKQAGAAFGSSWGERNTEGSHLEASGTAAGIGYLITAEQLATDNFRPRNAYNGDNLFAKLETHISGASRISASFGYNNGEGAGDEFQDYGCWVDFTRKNSYAGIRLETVPADWMSMTGFVHGIEQDMEASYFQLISGDLLASTQINERMLGAGVQTEIVLSGANTAAAGVDCPILSRCLHYGRQVSPQHVSFDGSCYKWQGETGSAAEERLAWSNVSIFL